jgi:hypothetical protein
MKVTSESPARPAPEEALEVLPVLRPDRRRLEAEAEAALVPSRLCHQRDDALAGGKVAGGVGDKGVGQLGEAGPGVGGWMGGWVDGWVGGWVGG